MKKRFLIIVLFWIISCTADSFLRRINKNDIVIGKYDPNFLLDSRIIFPLDEEYEKVRGPQFDKETKNKLDNLFDSLGEELDKDPIFKKTLADIETIEEKVDEQWDKILEIAKTKISADAKKYYDIIEARRQEIAKTKEYQELLEQMHTLFKKCFPQVERVERQIIEELKKRNIAPDEWIPGMPIIDYNKVPQDIIDTFKQQLKEMGIIFDATGKITDFHYPESIPGCMRQFRDLETKMLDFFSDPQIIAAQEEIIKLKYSAQTYAQLYSYTLQKELGIEKFIQIQEPIAEKKIKELGIREKLQEIRKTLSKDILKTQQEYDMAVDRIIDKSEKIIQKILDERRAQKATPGVA